MNGKTGMHVLVACFSAGIVASTMPAAGSAQSFDCLKATTAVEKMICADHELAKLDEEMARAFGDARKRVDANAIGQPAWLKDVRNRCASVDCLKEAYRSRIAHLRNLRPPAAFSVDGLVGEWTRVGSTPNESATLTIDTVTPNGFHFEIGATYGPQPHVGQIEGEAATGRGGAAIYRDEETKCQVTFRRNGARLVVSTSTECDVMGGMGVTFNGEFRNRKV